MMPTDTDDDDKLLPRGALSSPRNFFESCIRKRKPAILKGHCASILNNNTNYRQDLSLSRIQQLVFSSSSSPSSSSPTTNNGSSVVAKATNNGSNHRPELQTDHEEKEQHLVEVNQISSSGITNPTDGDVASSSLSSPSPSFAPQDGSKVLSMPFQEFCNHLMKKSNDDSVASCEDYYMTTQPLPSDDEGRPAVYNWLTELLLQNGILPLRPALLGRLIPMNVGNVWIGRQSSRHGGVPPRSSGLHHDFHDNLYLLLAGTKTIRLAPPTAARHFQMQGTIHTIHANGRIVYQEQIGSRSASKKLDGKNTTDTACPIRPDGALVSVERIVQLELRREAIESQLQQVSPENNGGNSSVEDLEQELAQIEEELLDIEMENDDTCGDEEDGGSSNVDDGSGDVCYDDDVDDDDVDLFGQKLDQPPKKKPRRTGKSSISSGEEKDSKQSSSNHGVVSATDEATARTNTHDHNQSVSSHSSCPLPSLPPNFVLKENDQVRFQTIELQAADALYLPAGWFHEVFSSGNATSTTNDDDDNDIHLAINYWVHPPDTGSNFDQPYNSGFWQRDWEARNLETAR